MEVRSVSPVNFGAVKIAPGIRKEVSKKLKNCDSKIVDTLNNACDEFKDYEFVHLRIDENVLPIVEDGKFGNFGEYFRFTNNRKDCLEMQTVWKGPSINGRVTNRETLIDFASELKLNEAETVELREKIRQAKTPLTRAIELVKAFEAKRIREDNSIIRGFYFVENEIAKLMSKVGQ